MIDSVPNSWFEHRKPQLQTVAVSLHRSPPSIPIVIHLGFDLKLYNSTVHLVFLFGYYRLLLHLIMFHRWKYIFIYTTCNMLNYVINSKKMFSVKFMVSVYSINITTWKRYWCCTGCNALFVIENKLYSMNISIAKMWDMSMIEIDFIDENIAA